MTTTPLFLVVDLFCGAGGTSTGFAQAMLGLRSVSKVIACVNHDLYAIKSHARNHPTAQHFTEDIRALDISELLKVVRYWQNKYPNALLIIWASLECTNFSRAKGGLPRDMDSRTLAENLYMHYNPITRTYDLKDSYIQLLNPDYIMIENVVEFMSWGPLDDKGKPVSQKNGSDWLRWRKDICNLGYTDRWEELNAANFGAHTHRNRLFGLFAKPGLPMSFPEPTHTKEPSKNGLFGDLEKWNAVNEKLDLNDKGQSIFNRKKPLSEKTLQRIYTGLTKHTKAGAPAFLSLYYGTGGTHASIFNPCPVIPTKDRVALVTTELLGENAEPGNSQYFLLNPSWGGNTGSIDSPCCVVVARQDKAPLYLIESEMGPISIPVYDSDSAMTVKIKQFMADHGILNIRMRMLRIVELLKIQGFPADYFLAGTKTKQKKYIGNSVVPIVVKVWIEALAINLLQYPERQAA